MTGKTYQIDLAKQLLNDLKSAEKPEKTVLQKKDLLEVLSPAIRRLHNRRFTNKEIVEIVHNSSGGEVMLSVNEISKVLSTAQTQRKCEACKDGTHNSFIKKASSSDDKSKTE